MSWIYLMGIEQAILARSVIREIGDVDRRAGIRSRIVQKRLNRLEYKWKEVQKTCLLMDINVKMLNTKKTFLEEMRLLLPYFVEFDKDDSILEKDYPDDCTVERPLYEMRVHFWPMMSVEKSGLLMDKML